MILKVPVYVDVQQPLRPDQVKDLVTALNQNISAFFIRKEKIFDYNLVELKLKALFLEMELHGATVVTLDRATEFLRTGK
jgi:hypothetical protein